VVVCAKRREGGITPPSSLLISLLLLGICFVIQWLPGPGPRVRRAAKFVLPSVLAGLCRFLQWIVTPQTHNLQTKEGDAVKPQNIATHEKDEKALMIQTVTAHNDKRTSIIPGNPEVYTRRTTHELPPPAAFPAFSASLVSDTVATPLSQLGSRRKRR
jgi:hypothetical protein